MDYSYNRRVALDEDAMVEKIEKRLQADLGKLVQGAGKIVEIRAYPPAKGGGWVAVLDKEYAALKVFYKYRQSDVSLSKVPAGWSVTVK